MTIEKAPIYSQYGGIGIINTSLWKFDRIHGFCNGSCRLRLGVTRYGA